MHILHHMTFLLFSAIFAAASAARLGRSYAEQHGNAFCDAG
jgi:hypothetical protein